MYIKADRVTITFGDIDLDAYQSSTGEYFLPLPQVSEAIDMLLEDMMELRHLELAKTMYPRGFGNPVIFHVEGALTRSLENALEYSMLATISLEDVVKYWYLAAIETQNAKAMSLVLAMSSIRVR